MSDAFHRSDSPTATTTAPLPAPEERGTPPLDDTLVDGRPLPPAGPLPPAEPLVAADRPVTPGWVIALLILALLLGAAGIGAAIYAVNKVPAHGTAGSQGVAGKTGPAGPTGAKGATGPAGSPGTVISPTPVNGTAVSTSADPAPGTTLTADTTCPTGKVLLSGGAQVTATGGTKDVALQSSYPSSATTWVTTAVVQSALPTGSVMTLRPYALCGTEPAKTAGAF